MVAGRPEKALFKNRPEHDDELAQVHVMLFRVAIDHQRQQQHILQLRFSELFGKKLPGGAPRSDGKGIVGGKIVFRAGGIDRYSPETRGRSPSPTRLDRW